MPPTGCACHTGVSSSPSAIEIHPTRNCCASLPTAPGRERPGGSVVWEVAQPLQLLEQLGIDFSGGLGSTGSCVAWEEGVAMSIEFV